jgi:hypothetical protein
MNLGPTHRLFPQMVKLPLFSSPSLLLEEWVEMGDQGEYSGFLLRHDLV